MPEKINTGTVLIKEGTFFPECLQLESEPYSKGWRLVKKKNLHSSGLDRTLFESGWTLFYMADEIHATVLGFDLEKATRRAVKKALAQLRSDSLNCLEISLVVASPFLGLVRVSVSAHPRHVQEGSFLFHAKHLAEQDRTKLVAAST